MNDLVSYNDKHNEANGEENRDGTSNNLSWNCGAEGATDNPEIDALREKQQRNLLATLLLSQGVPMLQAGDETGRTQHGNNNAYCQDNEISWVSWTDDAPRGRLFEFATRLIALRRAHPIFRRRNFFTGETAAGGAKDIVWLKPDGVEMTPDEWAKDFARCLGVYLAGDALNETDTLAQRVSDKSFLMLFNAHHDAIAFRLPEIGGPAEWHLQFDTALENGAPAASSAFAGAEYPLQGRSLVLLEQREID